MPALHYRKDTDLPWRRVKRGRGFTVLNQQGKFVGPKAYTRIESLVIPPAWQEVVVSADPMDYIQAIGTDAEGRRQYIYHPEWVKRSQQDKFNQLIEFGERLPTLRQTVRAHMGERGLTKDRVVATVVWLLEHTFIRVGNKEYADEHQSYGLTTMRGKHVEVKGNTLQFSFEGKSGVYHELDVTHPRVAQTIRVCLELPGYELFQYFDDEKNKKTVDSQDVNDYLKEHTGADFSAKDFRTWGGSVLAGHSLYKKGNAEDEQTLKTNIAATVEEVSELLGNTKAVCRTYYIHPTIIKSYEKKKLVPYFARSLGQPPKKLKLSPREYATWSLIKNA